MTYWKTPGFKALQDLWYQRLEDEGFHDAEKTVAGQEVLKQRSEHAYRELNEIVKICKESYYKLLGQYVHDELFKREIDRVVMLMHADGKMIREIVAELQRRETPRARNSIRFIIRRYEMKWGIRLWTRRQLNNKG